MELFDLSDGFFLSNQNIKDSVGRNSSSMHQMISDINLLFVVVYNQLKMFEFCIIVITNLY